MAFPDYPFPSGDKSFLHHRDVLAYLENFATDHNLFPYIRFNTLVKGISHDPEKAPSWNVTVQDISNGQTSTSRFQAVMVCNGQVHFT